MQINKKELSIDVIDFNKDGVEFVVLPYGVKCFLGRKWLEIDFGNESVVDLEGILNFIKRDRLFYFKEYYCIKDGYVVLTSDNFLCPVGLSVEEVGRYFNLRKNEKRGMFYRAMSKFFQLLFR